MKDETSSSAVDYNITIGGNKAIGRSKSYGCTGTGERVKHMDVRAQGKELNIQMYGHRGRKAIHTMEFIPSLRLLMQPGDCYQHISLMYHGESSLLVKRATLLCVFFNEMGD